MKVMIACQCGTNKGDRAIAEFLVKELKNYGAEITLSTSRPDLWNVDSMQNVDVIPMGYPYLSRSSQGKFVSRVTGYFQRKVLDKILMADMVSEKGQHFLCKMMSKKFYKKICEMDIVIVTGGHHITSLREENAFFSYTYDIGLISMYAKKYVLWSQTIGPLEFSSETAKNFFGKVINNAEKVYIRDENSFKCIRELYGGSDNLVKTYDSVFGYGNMSFPDINEREKKIGVSIFDGLKKAFKTYGSIAKTLDRYETRGYAIEFFRMEYDEQELNSIKQVISLMNHKDRVTIHPFMTTTEEHLREVASCRCFIGYKTHSVIMSLTTATPLIAIAYHQKTIDFMREFGMDEYALEDSELDDEKMEKCVSMLDMNLDKIQQKQRAMAQEMAQKLKKDLSEMVNNEQ